jgi:predicted AAA+ superfamily ATPase
MHLLSLDSITLLERHAAALLLYQSVMQEPIAEAFLAVLQSLRQEDELECLRAYGKWFQELAAANLGWQAYLLRQILQADNPFSRQVQKREISPALIAAVQHDLRALQQLYYCDGKQLSEWVQAKAGLETAPIVWEPLAAEMPLPLEINPNLTDWADLVPALTNHYRQFGVGLFAEYRAFRWQQRELVGVAHPDPIRLEALVGYESQKTTLQQNTEALLAGFPALHVLLYGSRGSGKSSLVKALLSEYGTKGLRLLEVSKADLRDLPVIVDRLRDAPQKFIIFVDDLSFEEDDDAYKALKVVLEGNITARPPNVVVYATSNRRHLIREFFDDRPRPRDADEVHHWDTVQEKLSFSDRFGLTLTFEPANQDTYLAIVHHLAQQSAIPIDVKELEFQALQWATRHNGRSGRTARQFIDFLQAKLSANHTATAEVSG